jgi:N-acetylneuraminic acid mutarotase
MTLRILFLYALALSSCLQVRGAVTFSISPSTVANDYKGAVNLQIAGLNVGEAIDINQYLDLNGNGVVDTSDLLQGSFRLSDGGATVIGGVTNINLPRDSNAISGAITVPLDFSSLSFEKKIIGAHMFIVSSSTARFTPITNTLAISAGGFAQSISGNIKTSGTAVPYAMVVLLVPNGGNYSPGPGVVADALGNFLIKAPTNTYAVAAFKPGFVTQFSTAPVVNLAAGASATANPTLTAADRTVTGRFVDAANPSVGVPGMLVTADSNDTGGFVLGTTDATGAFTLGVTSGNWRLSISEEGGANGGFLKGDKFSVNATGGSVANVVIQLTRETAMIYGRVTDEQNNPFVGARPLDDLMNGDLSSSTRTDSNGNFALPATAGTWSLIFDPPEDTTLAGYIYPNLNSIAVSAGSAVQINIVARKATNTISGMLRNTSNQAIAGIQIHATATLNGVLYQSNATTDTNGFYAIKVTSGIWSVYPDCGSDSGLPAHGYPCADQQNATISANNATVNFVPGQSAPPNFPSQTLPDATPQQFYSQVLVASGTGTLTWSLTGGSLPPGLNLTSNGTISGTPTTAGTFSFTARVSNGSSFTERGLSINVLPTGAGWSRKAFMPTARVAPAADVINGKMYVVGGFGNGGSFTTLEAYDPSQGTWQSLAPMSIGRGRLGASGLNGKLYVAGGFGDSNAGTAFEVYDTATGQWQTLPVLKSSRYGCASAFIGNKLYVVGGTTDPIRSMEIYDLATGAWSYGEPVPTQRFLLAAATVNNKLYAIGGAVDGQNRGVLEVYDPVADSWARKSSMPANANSSEIAAAVYNGKILVTGGFGSTISVYDPATDQWSALPDMPTSRGDVAAVVIGDAFLVAAGTPLPGGVLLPVLEQYRTTAGDPVITTILKSDGSITAAGIGFGVPSLSKFDRMNAGTITNLTFTSALTTVSGANISLPDGSPSGVELITIPPGDGENGFFKTKFTLPAAYSGAQLSLASSADDMSRIFLNGVAVTPTMVQGDQYQDRFFAVTNPTLFHAGDNEILIANANYFGGASAVAFYGLVTYRPAASLTALSRAGGQFQFSASIEALKTYTFEYTLNFQNWNTLVTTSSPSTSITIIDPNATNNFRAYRINSQ